MINYDKIENLVEFGLDETVSADEDNGIEVIASDLVPEVDEAILIQEVKAEAPAQKKRHSSQKGRRIAANTVIHILLVIMSIVWLAPFVCIVFESFRVESTGRVGYIIPKQWGFDNYINLFTKTKFPRWLLNTFLVGLAVSVLQTVFVLSMSYVLSRFRF